MGFKFRKDAEPICTSEFHYDLFTGGYINPEDILEPEDAKAVNEAIALINAFEYEAERKGLLEHS